MSNLKLFKAGVIVAFVFLSFESCKKFEVLSNIDPDIVTAGENLKAQTVWEFISSRSTNRSIDTLKSLNLYAAAIERVGLKDLLNGEGDFTVIAPRNEAMKSLALELGYPTIDAVPSALLKNYFLDNIISKRVKSFDLEISKFQVVETLNGDSLSFVRQPSSTDQYVFNLYNSPTFSTALVKVRSQNLECKNGVVHVVDAITSFRPKFLPAEAGKAAGDTIIVAKDAYLNNGSSALKGTNYGSLDYMWIKKNNDANITRRSITQFPVKAASFPEPISSATLGLFVTRSDNPGGTVSVYRDQQVDWGENTVNWANSPVPGTAPLSSAEIRPFVTKGWFYFDVSTAYKTALANGDQYINLGINTAVNALFQFATKETRDSNLILGGYKAFLVLTPPASTLLVNPVNTGLSVDLVKGYKKITISELSFGGTTNNNITYTITSKPQNGFLVVNGLVSPSFTQAQIEKGAVKYLYSGTAAGTDSFTVVAKDFKNGTFPTPQVVNIQIQ
ncbi:CBM96 family carbohydrate-binding protein [Pedobacter psychrophilus]|nr:DNRLRE domain-containing protein [Pedobacter psychrophilus]